MDNMENFDDNIFDDDIFSDDELIDEDIEDGELIDSDDLDFDLDGDAESDSDNTADYIDGSIVDDINLHEDDDEPISDGESDFISETCK